ncbi:MAG TPA: hypothetical protein VLH10_20655 [Yinghuangia sp.]|nr:hypothetical protein [Yinghuangia sp.]
MVAALCAHPDAGTRRAAYRRFPAWAGWAPDQVAQLHTVVRDLTMRDGWKEAADAAHVLFTDGFGTEAYAETVDTLASTASEGPDARADRDRPAAQRLAYLVRMARSWARNSPHVAGAAVRTLARRLTDRHGLTHEGVLLLAEAVPLGHAPSDAVTADLRDLAQRCGDRPVLAFRASERLAARADDPAHGMTPHQLLPTATELTAEGTAATGFFALALIRAVGPESGWPAEWRALVSTLRAHPDPDVRDAACGVATAQE